MISTHVRFQWQWRTVARYALHLSLALASLGHPLSSDGACWRFIAASVSSPCPCTEHMPYASPHLMVHGGIGSFATAGSPLPVRTFVIGGEAFGDLRERISPKSRMRAPNSDLKAGVLDDLALRRGGRLFKVACEQRTESHASCLSHRPRRELPGWGETARDPRNLGGQRWRHARSSRCARSPQPPQRATRRHGRTTATAAPTRSLRPPPASASSRCRSPTRSVEQHRSRRRQMDPR